MHLRVRREGEVVRRREGGQLGVWGEPRGRVRPVGEAKTVVWREDVREEEGGKDEGKGEAEDDMTEEGEEVDKEEEIEADMEEQEREDMKDEAVEQEASKQEASEQKAD